MRLNRNELKKIQYDFNSCANRLLQADFSDYTETLKKFLRYIDNTPIINEYIKDCGTSSLNIEEEVREVQNSYGGLVFTLGETDEEEIRNVYAVLRYLVDTNNCIYHTVSMGYSYSSKFQDNIKGFNDRFVMVLIRHIERYLTKIGIDMGLDEKNIYNVTVQNGQAIIANDNSSVTATANIGIDTNELEKLIEMVKEAATNIDSGEDKETVEECLEVIATEAAVEKPKKSMLKMAISSLKGVKGTTEFFAAVTALVTFVSNLL